jgi:hypothetical protein
MDQSFDSEDELVYIMSDAEDDEGGVGTSIDSGSEMGSGEEDDDEDGW